jgi:hypothetical protein
MKIFMAAPLLQISQQPTAFRRQAQAGCQEQSARPQDRKRADFIFNFSNTGLRA